MNRMRLVGIALILTTLCGCESIKEWMHRDRDLKSTKPLPPVQPDQLLAYINERAERLQSIEYEPINMTISAPHLLLSPTLRGWLVAGQPRNFNLVAEGTVAGKVILGSNAEQFWVYVSVPREEPTYVYASHADFAAGNAKLPGGIPFEPDWVLQALGMLPLPPNNRYTARVDQKSRTYTLSWPATLPNGNAVVKEIIFDGDPATGTKSQIKKHQILDAKNKVLCWAEIKQARTVQLPQTDPRTGLPLAIQYPTRVVLRWDEQKFEMDLALGSAKINKPFSDEEARRYFTRPNIPNATPINLAQYQAPLR
ncbi:MAG: hypothetical protein RMJ56_14095 [Gemmataceae bacterium]|nr:hypothetical protein [Gemmata sp.]MDW8198724.1 hypothetical protein [Gemmataceae bacterium]